MDFSPFNFYVWLIFTGFCAVVWLTVKIFHSKWPDYPGYSTQEENDR